MLIVYEESKQMIKFNVADSNLDELLKVAGKMTPPSVVVYDEAARTYTVMPWTEVLKDKADVP